MPLNQDGSNFDSIAYFATATKETAATTSIRLTNRQGKIDSRCLAVVQPFVVAEAHFAVMAVVARTNSRRYFDHLE
jgi:hypothetical protein